MSSVVAIVKSIVGQVFVVSPEGIRRVLVEGDRLFVGDQVDTGLAGAVTLELADGRTLDTEGLFIELGSKGALELATQIGVQLDSESFKYIATNNKQETNIPGIYAAGDIVGPPYQMAKAVGEGCVAGMEAAGYARRMKKAE